MNHHHNTEQVWLILRTSGRNTMRLAESLSRDGFEVWTPVETRMVEVPRVNVKREVRLPIMPSYVFASVKDRNNPIELVDLLQLADMPVKPRRGPGLREAAHADFSVMHAFGRIPLVPDVHLTALRRLEQKRTPIKRAPYAFPKNTKAKVKEGIGQGLIGVVVRSTEKETVLSIIGGRDMKIPTSYLELDDVCGTSIAVRKAA